MAGTTFTKHCTGRAGLLYSRFEMVVRTHCRVVVLVMGGDCWSSAWSTKTRAWSTSKQRGTGWASATTARAKRMRKVAVFMSVSVWWVCGWRRGRRLGWRWELLESERVNKRMSWFSSLLYSVSVPFAEAHTRQCYDRMGYTQSGDCSNIPCAHQINQSTLRWTSAPGQEFYKYSRKLLT